MEAAGPVAPVAVAAVSGAAALVEMVEESERVITAELESAAVAWELVLMPASELILGEASALAQVAASGAIPVRIAESAANEDWAQVAVRQGIFAQTRLQRSMVEQCQVPAVASTSALTRALEVVREVQALAVEEPDWARLGALDLVAAKVLPPALAVAARAPVARATSSLAVQARVSVAASNLLVLRSGGSVARARMEAKQEVADKQAKPI